MSCSKRVSLFVSVKKGRVGPICSGLGSVYSLGCLDAPAVGGVPRESRDTQSWRLGLVPGRTGLYTCLHRGSVVPLMLLLEARIDFEILGRIPRVSC